MADILCPHDGSPMRREVRPMNLAYQNYRENVDMPGWYCPVCGEAIHVGRDMQASDRALHRMKALADGMLSAAEIRRVRKKLGLTQKEAGLKIGGGVRAFQKYESGDLLPSQGIDSALRLLDHDPSQLFVLDARGAAKASRRRGQGAETRQQR